MLNPQSSAHRRSFCLPYCPFCGVGKNVTVRKILRYDFFDSLNIRFVTRVKAIEGLSCKWLMSCLLYTSPSPRDRQKSRMPSYA